MKRICNRLFVFLLFAIFGVTESLGMLPSVPDYSVGSIKGNAGVNAMGAATYDFLFSVPNGGAFTPQVGLAYSSQNGSYGIAGYGFDITGISTITSGGKDIFHDGEMMEAHYDASSSLYLDGKRLVLKSGSLAHGDAVFDVEGSPHTTVSAVGKFDTVYVAVDSFELPRNQDETTSYYYTYTYDPQITISFIVHTPDGSSFEYGTSNESRISFNENNKALCAAWYLTKSTDKFGNVIEYSYSTIDNRIYPETIKYGLTYNSQHTKVRDTNCTISFAYENLTIDPPSYYIKDHKITTTKRLKEVACKEGNILYRKYYFTYSTNLDGCTTAKTRLYSITESNGNGESLPPTVFDWNGIPMAYISRRESSASMNSNYYYNSLLNLDKKKFFSFDVNNDGLTDLIRIDSKNIEDGECRKISVNLAQKGSNGDINFTSEVSKVTINRKSKTSGRTYYICLYPSDFDGDGINEIIEYSYYERDNHYYAESCLLKYSNNELTKTTLPAIPLSRRCVPLITTLDWNGDGRDEILFLETERSGSTYSLHVIGYNNEGTQYTNTTNYLSISDTPKRLFTGDYDNDGRGDLMVICDNSFKIFSKSAFAPDGSHSNITQYLGANVYNSEKIEQGDFNGDGLQDFILFVNENNIDKYYIAFGKGDGSFTASSKQNLSRKIKKEDDEPTLRAVAVYDIDGDGKSDILTVQKGLAQIVGTSNSFSSKTIVNYIAFNGISRNNISSYEFGNKGDDHLSDEFIFTSDFDGDGITELANFGTRLDENNSTNYNNCIHVYKNNSLSSSGIGKLASVTDGFGIETSFSYDVITNPDIYERGASSFPVNSYTLPISVVRSKTITNGNSVVSNETYSYKDLKVHLQGKGMLGFSEITKTDSILETTERTKIEQWDDTLWIPSRTKTWIAQGGATATTEAVSSISHFDNNKNFFAYVSENTETDFDGNIVVTTCTYDTNKGVPQTERVAYGEGMFKQTNYINYVQKSGVWLPQNVITLQKHEDDVAVYTFSNRYSYDSYGNIVQKIEGGGKSKQMTKNSTYDSYGNILSKTDIKAGKTITEFFEYDTTGRYITKAYQSPDMGCKLYKYDYFGNVIEERDSINADHVLITRHEYDGWGRRTKTVNPDNTFVEYSIAWNDGGGYKTVESPNNAPSITTVFDALGRKLSKSTKGRKGIDIISFTEYNSKGQIASVSKTEGNLTVGTSYTYDRHGRKTREESTSGAITTYDYGNRCITTSNGVTSVTSTYDAWGNVVEAVDSLCTVTYTYGSHGSPISISSNGHTVYMEYDDMGYRTSLTDPDAGTMSYTYTNDGTVLTQTDARGIITRYNYDTCGRLNTKFCNGIRHSYHYNTGGYGKYLLGSITFATDSVRYEYDRLRRVTKEHRKIGSKKFDKSYEYDALGNVSKVTYPGGLEVTYTYDALGFLDSVYANDSLIYHLNSFNGLTETISGVGGLKLKDSYDSYGFLTKKEVFKANNHSILSVGLTYNRMTGNVASRDILVSPEYADGGGIRLNDTDTADTQTIDILSITSGGVTNPIGPPINIRADRDVYTYDSMDRLITVTKNNRLAMAMEYDDCGNITYKTGIGEYTYDESCMPHAVMEVENRDGSAGSQNMLTSYHSNGKLESIVMDSLELVNTYRFDDEKWESQLLRNDSIIRTVFYFDDFEEITENDGTYLQYFLENNVIVIKRNGSFEYYQGFTDHLGNILDVYDSNGHAVFEARYDAWGKQTITRNDIGLRYGYTGHEMLPEFGLIDMKGRVYDPALGRFLSPDNYVQEPTNSQSFNRYSYCVNNPLKYTDPSGEFWHLIFGGLIGGVINWATHGCKFNWDGLKYFGVGAAAGVIGAGIAGGISSIIGGTSFMSGALGTAKAATSTGFFAGMASGAGAGFSGGFITGTGNSWIEGAGFKTAMLSGLISGGLGSITGAAIGGIAGGISAARHDLDFWTGQHKPIVLQCEPMACGQLVKSPEINLSEIPQVNINNNVAALPENALVNDITPKLIAEQKLVCGGWPEGQGSYSVYYGVDPATNNVKYVGITSRQPEVRFTEHINSGTARSVLQFKTITVTGNLSRTQARILEQTLINYYGLGKNGGELINVINSIAPKNWGDLNIRIDELFY